MSKGIIIKDSVIVTSDYNLLVDNISTLWAGAKAKAITAVNTELLEAN